MTANKSKDSCDDTLITCLQSLRDKKNVREVMLAYQNSLKYSSRHKIVESLIPLFTSIESLDSMTPDVVNCLLKVFTKLKDDLTNEQFEAFRSLTRKMLKNDTKNILELYKVVSSKTGFDMLTDEMLLILIKDGCEFSPANEEYILLLFDLLNTEITHNNKSVVEIQGIDMLISTVARDSSSTLARYVAKIYINAPEKMIDILSSHLNNESVLSIYLYLMRRLDRTHNDQIYQITRARHNSILNSSKIHLKNCNIEEITVPMNTTYEALREKIAYQLESDKDQIKLCSEGGKDIVAYNFKPSEEMTIAVSKEAVTQGFKFADSSTFVIPYLDRHRDTFWKLVKKGSENAFRILLGLSPIKKVEDQILKSSKNDWETIFDTSSKYIFLYRVNILSNILTNNVNFVEKFSKSRGLRYLLIIAVEHAIELYEEFLEFQEMVIDSAYLAIKLCNNEEFFKKSKTLSDVLPKLIKIIENTEQKQISNHYYSLLFEILSKMQSCDEITQNIIKIIPNIIFHPSQRVRNNLSEIIKLIDAKKLENIIIDLLPEAIKQTSVPYFKLLQDCIKNNSQNSIIYEKCKKFLIETYQKDKETENLPPDTFIEAILQVLTKIIEISQEFDQVLYDCIVDSIICTKNKYHCPTKHLLSLLEELIKLNPSVLSSLLPKLSTQMARITEDRKAKQNNYYFERDELDDLVPSDIKAHGGLRNLGTTCYLNSTLQQLYNVQEFRELILKTESTEKWLKKLQEVFAQFEKTRNTVDTSGFVKSWLWYGERVNPMEQQDAVEFLQALLDDVNSKIPGANAMFKGEIKASIEGVDVEYHYERNEEFITFPVEVSENHCLQDSFNAFLQPTLLEGDNQYKDEKLGKINAKMSHRITKAPKILILQLMRFTFNKQKMTRMKVNTKFTFPEKLDISELMSDDSTAVYDLSGVIVHIGSAHGGHYYSYVSGENDVWICYNDSRVSKSSTANVLKSTGGGKNSESAYLVFYRMREGTETKTEENKPEQKEESEDESSSSSTTSVDYATEKDVFDSLQKLYKNVLENTDSPAVALALLFSRDSTASQSVENKVRNMAEKSPELVYNVESMKLAIPYHTNNQMFFDIIVDIMKRTKNYDTYLNFLENSFVDMIRCQSTFEIITKPLNTAIELGADAHRIFKVVFSFLDTCDSHIKKTKIGLMLPCSEIFQALKSVASSDNKDQIQKIIDHPAIPRIQGAENEVCVLKAYLMNDMSSVELRNALFSTNETQQVEAFVTLAVTKQFDILNDCRKLPRKQLLNIAKNLPKYCSSSIQPFFVETNWWVMAWLVDVDMECRNAIKKSLYNSFISAKPIRAETQDIKVKENDKENLIKLVNLLLDFSDQVAKEVQTQFNDVYFNHQVQTMFMQYNELIAWSVIRSSSQNIFNTKVDSIISMLKRYNKIDSMKHQIISDLISLVVKCTSDFKEFFKDNQTFTKFLDLITKGIGASREGCRNIPELLVKSEVPEYFSGFFQSDIIKLLPVILRPDIPYSSDLLKVILKYLPKNPKILKNVSKSLTEPSFYYVYDNPGEPLLQKLIRAVLENDKNQAKLFVKSTLVPRSIERMQHATVGDYIILSSVLTATRDTNDSLTKDVWEKAQKSKWNFDYPNIWMLHQAFLFVNETFAEFSLKAIPDGFINDVNVDIKFEYLTTAITLFRTNEKLNQLLQKKVATSLTAKLGENINRWCGIVLPMLTANFTDIHFNLNVALRNSTAEAFGTRTRLFLMQSNTLGLDCSEPISRIFEFISKVSENMKPSVLKSLLEFALYFPELKEELKTLEQQTVEIMRNICKNMNSNNEDAESVHSIDALNLIDIVFGKKQ